MVLIGDIAKHASVRKSEWIMTGLMIHLGWVLSKPEQTFLNSKAFLVLAQYAAENTWALLFGVFGLVRLIVLILNGTHLKQSAELRMALSAFSFFILTLWVWGIDAAGTASTGGVTVIWLAIGELFNVWQASADRLERKKNGRKFSSGVV